jgi:hypothetical protein
MKAGDLFRFCSLITMVAFSLHGIKHATDKDIAVCSAIGCATTIVRQEYQVGA